jgi:uncharacterized RDD family membrane protein YckC
MKAEIISLGRPSLLRRFAAMFYDLWLLAALWLVTTAIMISIRMVFDSETLAEGERAISGNWKLPTFLAHLIIMYVFFTYFWVKNGQTLAMQTWRIHLVDENMQHISYAQAYKRLSFAIISFACFGLGYFWVLLDKDGMSAHDRLSKTQLILTPKRK